MKALSTYFPWNREKSPSRDLDRRSPFASLFQWPERGFDETALDRWLDDAMPVWPRRLFEAPYGVDEDEEAVTLQIDVPGFAAEDLAVQVSADEVSIVAKHDEQTKENGACRRAELQYRLALPSEVDSSQATAEVKHGVLKIRLPKTEQARQRVRKIPVAA